MRHPPQLLHYLILLYRIYSLLQLFLFVLILVFHPELLRHSMHSSKPSFPLVVNKPYNLFYLIFPQQSNLFSPPAQTVTTGIVLSNFTESRIVESPFIKPLYAFSWILSVIFHSSLCSCGRMSKTFIFVPTSNNF